MFCKKCGNDLGGSTKFCGKCGTPVQIAANQVPSVAIPVPEPEPTIACPQCGVACKIGARFCGKCGHSFAAPQTEVEKTVLNVPARAHTEKTVQESYPLPKPGPEPEETLSPLQPAVVGGNKNFIIAATASVAVIAAVSGWWMHSHQKEDNEPTVAATAPTAQAPTPPDSTNTPAPTPAPSPAAEAPKTTDAESPKASPPTTASTPAPKPAPAPGDKTQKAPSTQKSVASNGTGQKISPPSVPSPATSITPPEPQAKAAAKTIDEIYKERDAKKCDPGFSGFLCREKLRITLCDGHWAENPPPGKALCKQVQSQQQN